MDINLPEHQEAFINRQVQAGIYASPEAMIEEILQGIMHDGMFQLAPEYGAELEASLDKGLADIEAGRTKPFGEVVDRLKTEIRAKFNLA